jgi:hypothetical protein
MNGAAAIRKTPLVVDASALGLKPGTYLICLSSGSEVITRKIILVE